jgi:GNAT acetyltransferase-like protein
VEITVIPFAAQREKEWRAFLDSSNNGTLFHDLDFLAYHTPGRFQFQHLMFCSDNHLVALLPGGIVRDGDAPAVYQSPLGASIGGFVVKDSLRAETARALVAALKTYAAEQGYGAVKLRTGPREYMRHPDDLLGFSLAAEGFQLETRWLLLMTRLDGITRDGVLDSLTQGKRRDVRAGLRGGLECREAGAESLDEFYAMLWETNERHRSLATHTKDELARLYSLVPGRIRLVLCSLDGKTAAGTLVFMLNPQAAMTFYICSRELDGGRYATAVLGAHITQLLADEGIRYLDFGPTSFDDFSLNTGLALFKEGLGARGYCRDAWRWDRDR